MISLNLGGGILSLIALVVAILTIVHVWTKNRIDSTGLKVLWTILAVVFSIITGIVYYFVRVR